MMWAERRTASARDAPHRIRLFASAFARQHTSELRRDYAEATYGREGEPKTAGWRSASPALPRVIQPGVPAARFLRGGVEATVFCANSLMQFGIYDSRSVRQLLVFASVAWMLANSMVAQTPSVIVRDPKYPAHWWTPVPKEGAPSWEILPQEAGPGEVILSKRHELGLLSNFAPTPFTFRGKRYASLEGFWQMMLYP